MRKARCGFIIYVPQGNTAYQASDRRYYSRSEFEAKALPDHEIRLRMFRGRTPSATIRTVNWQVKYYRCYKFYGSANLCYNPKLSQEIASLPEDTALYLGQYEFDLVSENTSEINIA